MGWKNKKKIKKVSRVHNYTMQCHVIVLGTIYVRTCSMKDEKIEEKTDNKSKAKHTHKIPFGHTLTLQLVGSQLTAVRAGKKLLIPTIKT